MAKKKKIVINNQELTPTVLFVKQDRKKSSFFGFLWIVLIFGILIGCVYYMPEISTYVKQYINPDSDVEYIDNKKEEPKDTKKEVQEKKVVFYDYSNNLSVDIDKITVSNFQIDNMTLSFDIKGKNNESISLDDYNYYMTLYNDKNETLQTIKIKDGLVKSSEGVHQTYNLNSSDVSKLTFIQIEIDEYPLYRVSTDDSGNGVLVCSNDNNFLKYYFKNNKLYASEFVENVSFNSSDYNSKYVSYSSLFTSYENATGISTEIINNTDSTTFKITVDLSKNDGKQVNNIIRFNSGTDAKIVHFEVNASGYDCN